MSFLNRIVGTLIAFVVITLIIVGWFMPELRKQREQTTQLEELKKQIDVQKVLLAERTRQVDLLKNDRGYVETLARDRLDLMKEGETIIRIEAQASPTPQPTKRHSGQQ